MLTPMPHPERKLPLGLSNPPTDEISLRSLICHIGRLMHQARYIDGASGSISARLDAKHILATPDGLAKGFVQPDQLLVVDVGSEDNLPPTSDIHMHMECYKTRPDVFGVVSAHPVTAIALTAAGISMRTCVIPEAVIVLGLVPTASYGAPNSLENREAVRTLISQHDAMMLSHSGSVTVGSDVWQAYLKLETLEHTAIILHRIAQLGPITALPPAQVAKLLELRRALGYWRSGDEERFCEACGVC